MSRPDQPDAPDVRPLGGLNAAAFIEIETDSRWTQLRQDRRRLRKAAFLRGAARLVQPFTRCELQWLS